MNHKETINKIRTLLGLQVKLEQMKLQDGVTILEADKFEAGQAVSIVTNDGNVPLPIGDYNLEDGTILTVAEDGMIGEIKAATEASTEEITTEVEAAKDPIVNPNAPTDAQPVTDPKTADNADDMSMYVTKEEFDAALQEIKDYIGLAKIKNEELILSKEEEIEKLKVELDNKPAATKITHTPEIKETVNHKPLTKLEKIYQTIQK